MDEHLEESAQCLADAIGHLLSSRGPQGHWGDVRSTALAVWALSEVVSGPHSPHDAFSELRVAMDDARPWLAGQARREDGGFSWESEAWDTSLSILALSSSAPNTERVDQGVAWLQRIRDPESGVWYDEVWETTLSTVAILRAERSRARPSHDLSSWLEPVVKWFLEIPSKTTGEFVCPHYSGFLAWILAEIKTSRIAKRVQNTKAFRAFQNKVSAAVEFLIERADENSKPWCSYTFGNAYIAYGLCMLSRAQRSDLNCAATLARWLRTYQGADGGFEDAEDSAIAMAALAALINSSSDGKIAFEKTARLLPNVPCVIHTCFIGYSGKSQAIAAQVKESLAKRLPSLEIRDWRWDFQLGRVLVEEIEDASRECQIAIFLVTKDDQLVQTDETLVDSPRDNIIFEVGFFGARLGLDHTLLIVEKGVKIPSDWGGILYIPLSDRSHLADVNLALIDEIRRLLRS